MLLYIYMYLYLLRFINVILYFIFFNPREPNLHKPYDFFLTYFSTNNAETLVYFKELSWFYTITVYRYTVTN